MDFNKDFNDNGSDGAKTAKPFPKKIESCKMLG